MGLFLLANYEVIHSSCCCCFKEQTVSVTANNKLQPIFFSKSEYKSKVIKFDDWLKLVNEKKKSLGNYVLRFTLVMDGTLKS